MNGGAVANHGVAIGADAVATCESLANAQLAHRVKNIRYVAISLVDTSLNVTGSKLEDRWGK